MKMKISTKIILSAVLALPLVCASGMVSAEDTPTQTQSSNSSSNSTDQTPRLIMAEGELSPEQQKALKDRLEKRKTELKTRLTAAEQQRLKTRCKNAQGKLSSLNGRIQGIETSRGEVYENLISRLTSLEERLQQQGADTATLETQIETLKTKVETFKTDLAAYKQAVTDLSAMDCVSDPTAFKASLETARTALGKVKQDVLDIRTYVKETVKTTLKQIRSALEGNSGDDSAGESTNTSGGSQ